MLRVMFSSLQPLRSTRNLFSRVGRSRLKVVGKRRAGTSVESVWRLAGVGIVGWTWLSAVAGGGCVESSILVNFAEGAVEERGVARAAFDMRRAIAPRHGALVRETMRTKAQNLQIWISQNSDGADRRKGLMSGRCST